MNFLIDEIRNQKFLEHEVDVENLISEKNISKDSIVFKYELDKKVFKDEVEVKEYLKSKYVYNYELETTDTMYVATVVSAAQVDFDTEIELEIRRGVKVYAADLLPIMPLNDVLMFSAKGELTLGNDLGEIKLSEGLPYIIEVARVAEGDHPSYGKLKITQEHLESFVNNFKSKVTGVDLAINEDHKKNEAFGWFKDVFLSFDKQRVYAQVLWNTKGTTALSEKQYRYFSPEFRFNYTHPHTGKEHGATLLGGALTNYPFLKMDAITELSEKSNKERLKVQTIDLNEHNKIIVELNAKMNEVQAKLDAASSREIELNSKVKSLEEAIEKKNKETAHKKLFDDGKINAAQLVALNEGKSMLEVIALNEPMNTKGAGATGSVKEKAIELSADDKAIAAKLNLTEEEYINANKL